MTCAAPVVDGERCPCQGPSRTVSERQAAQASRMLKKSRSRLSELRVGDSVRVGIPDVDRSRIEQRNLIGVVLEVRSSLIWLGDNICLSVMNAADTFYC